MNEFLHREEGELLHHRTLADYILSVGEKAAALMTETVNDTLRKNNFDPNQPGLWTSGGLRLCRQPQPDAG